MRMPFGKHRGVDVRDLPDGYLNWLLTIDLREPLLSAVTREWAFRFGDEEQEFGDEEEYYAPPPPQGEAKLTYSPAEQPLLKEIVERGYRAVALKAHPDVGGSTDVMRKLNGLIAKLRSQFR
jgi:hypothetical protein